MKSNGASGVPLLKVAVRSEPDIVTARQKARTLAGMLAFDAQDQARLATAVSELARNVYQYAGSGSVEFFFNEPLQIFLVKVSDAGPGISALPEILGGTYQSKTGMGLGLIGTKKLMDSFDVETTRGGGTVVTIGKVKDARSQRIDKTALHKLIDQMLLKPASNPFEEMQHQNQELLQALEENAAAKRELISLNEELAETNRGVVALYAELDDKAVALQRANELKTSFLSNMTHEFRTPLSAIVSLTRLLLNHTDGELGTEQAKQVTFICKSADGLLDLVNDLLDLAKVEAGKVSVHLGEFSVEEVLSGLRGMFRPILSGMADIDCVFEVVGKPFHFNSDQAKVSQILRNLVSNAVKFTEKGSIHLSAFLNEAGLAVFEVADAGIGLDPSHLETVFDDFSQIESKLQRKQKGSGLGLPLSRKLARLLGGDLSVESTLGNGSKFSLTLPCFYAGEAEAVLFGEERPSGAKTGPAGGSADREKFRVLIVDPDESSRYVVKNLVNKEIDAIFEETGDEVQAGEILGSRPPDLLVFDPAAFKQDGVFLLEQWDRAGSLSRVAVIVNSALEFNEAERGRLSSRSVAILGKDRSDLGKAVVELRTALRAAGFDYRPA